MTLWVAGMISPREFVEGPWRAVPVLGVTQILSWGTIFYTPVLIVPLIAADRGWSISFSMGGFSVAGADFLTADSPSQVADFYKKHYPNAMVVSEGEDHDSIMVTTSKGMVTVAIQPYEGKTKISIARMTGAKVPGSEQPN